jgi:small conductance mechanosensitive channel
MVMLGDETGKEGDRDMRVENWLAQGGISSFRDFWESIAGKISALAQDEIMWQSAALMLVRILLIWLFSRVLLIIINRIIDRAVSGRSRLKFRSRRVQTVGRLLKNTAGYAVNFIAILLILGEFNINLAPLLAGAGVLGLAVGFGAQSLIKDIISGFFIILEDQFSVGDVIETGKYKGTVEMIGLRATRIRSWTGEVHVIPNGSINDVTNFSINNALAVIDIPVASTDSAEWAEETIRQVLRRIENPNLVREPELLGIQTIGASDLIFRIVAECRPNTQAEVTRLLNMELKKAFEAERNPRFFRNEQKLMGG